MLLVYGLFQKGRVLAQDGIHDLRHTATSHAIISDENLPLVEATETVGIVIGTAMKGGVTTG